MTLTEAELHSGDQRTDMLLVKLIESTTSAGIAGVSGNLFASPLTRQPYPRKSGKRKKKFRKFFNFDKKKLDK